ncbi:MAG TPA: hypothetical protein VGR19_04830 [Allosphingosinicella sp.]|nr:hypothetical protein [Allosphingosinicella sp.]
MKPMLIAAAALALPLSGCKEPAPEADDANITVPEGDYAQRIAGMDEGARNAVFLRAIRDAGRDCQQVERSASQGEVNGAPAWTATCDNGVQWTVMIGRDGVATVASTEELQAAARPGQAQ